MINDFTIREAGEAIRRGDITSRILTESTLSRIKEKQPLLNCYLRIDHESALKMADKADDEIASGNVRGPLHGIPLAHKDVFDRIDKITSAGSKVNNITAVRQCTVMDHLDQAGAVYLGALNLDEFAAGGTGANDHYGRTRNPWNTEYITGGSSSGSGACVAARCAHGALGGDAGGSIRIPAAMCGIVGLKPTFGRVSRDGTARRTFSVDCTGPMARTAEDCALILQVIAGYDPSDSVTADVPVPDYKGLLRHDLRGVRIGIAVGGVFDHIETEVSSRLQIAHQVLEELGAELVDVVIPDLELINDLQQVFVKSEAAVICGRLMRKYPEKMTHDSISVVQEGLLIPATRYLEAQALRTQLLESHVRTIYSKVDVMFSPVLSGSVPTISETDFEEHGAVEELFTRSARLTRFANYLGTPALSVPCGFLTDGLPTAFQLHAPPFSEARILAVAHAFQTITDHHQKAPQICHNP